MDKGTCIIDGCPSPVLARGWCSMHYKRWQTLGDPGEAEPSRYMGGRMRECRILGCDVTGSNNPALCKSAGVPLLIGDLCRSHHYAIERYGDASRAGPKMGENHYSWAGDDVGYGGAHSRVIKARGRASLYKCENCGKTARDWAYNGLDPNQVFGRRRARENSCSIYSIDVDYYVPMCRKCHLLHDRAKNTADLQAFRVWWFSVGQPELIPGVIPEISNKNDNSSQGVK